MLQVEFDFMMTFFDTVDERQKYNTMGVGEMPCTFCKCLNILKKDLIRQSKNTSIVKPQVCRGFNGSL